MKHLGLIIFYTFAFIVLYPCVFIYHLWDFDFSEMKDMRKEYLQTVAKPIYDLFKVKTSYYDEHITF